MLRSAKAQRARVARAGTVASALVALVLVPAFATGAAAGGDPLHTVGPKQCAECHESEVQVWKRTEHYTHARSLTRDPKASSIARAVGVRRIKSDERCASCHFTTTQAEGRRPRASDGVSCESCHGGARDWIDVHGNYGGASVTRAGESAAHRKQRVAASNQAGMHRTEDLYDLTAACFGCHVVGDEALVNQGGHPAGSDLDFVAYTQGEMRHNFVRGARDENRVSDAARQQQMFVVSRMLELEHALRALALASQRGTYLEAHSARVRRLLGELRQIAKRAPAKELRSAIQSAGAVKLAAGQREGALAAAKRVGAQARALARPTRAAELAGVQALMSRPSSRSAR